MLVSKPLSQAGSLLQGPGVKTGSDDGSTLLMRVADVVVMRSVAVTVEMDSEGAVGDVGVGTACDGG